MTRITIVVDRAADWRWNREGLDVVVVDEFLRADQNRRPSAPAG